VFSGAVGKPESIQGERATEMASKKVIVPLVGTNVKKGVNYVKDADGKPVVVEEEGRGRGRPTLHELSAVVAKSFEIIQTIGAGPRDMGKVAVAYFDKEFVAYNEGERVRLQKLFRELGVSGVNSRQTGYKRLLDGCNLEYRWLVEAAQIKTPEGRFLYLVHAMSQEKVKRRTKRNTT
jgi:hypothetical protein